MSEDGKIIVDDDWKSQAQREKEELSEKLDTESPEQREMPEASLMMHLEGLVVQSMMMLGLMEYPGMEGQRVFDPLQAKFLIDTVVILRDKTKGNCTKEEEEYFNKVIPELQMTWVEVTKAVAEQAGKAPAEGGEGAEASSGPSIITE